MLRQTLIHPEILAVLARAGHHATILLADGNYPASTAKGPNAVVVSLNLSPGLVTCNQALAALLSAVPIEQANTMMYESEGPYALDADPPVWADYRATLAAADVAVPLLPIEKWKFYEAVATPSHVLTIQTGDRQRFANLLLTVGVRLD